MRWVVPRRAASAGQRCGRRSDTPDLPDPGSERPGRNRPGEGRTVEAARWRPHGGGRTVEAAPAGSRTVEPPPPGAARWEPPPREPAPAGSRPVEPPPPGAACTARGPGGWPHAVPEWALLHLRRAMVGPLARAGRASVGHAGSKLNSEWCPMSPLTSRRFGLARSEAEVTRPPGGAAVTVSCRRQSA
jgi:hypothetical protein